MSPCLCHESSKRRQRKCGKYVCQEAYRFPILHASVSCATSDACVSEITRAGEPRTCTRTTTTSLPTSTLSTSPLLGAGCNMSGTSRPRRTSSLKNFSTRRKQALTATRAASLLISPRDMETKVRRNALRTPLEVLGLPHHRKRSVSNLTSTSIRTSFKTTSIGGVAGGTSTPGWSPTPSRLSPPTERHRLPRPSSRPPPLSPWTIWMSL